MRTRTSSPDPLAPVLRGHGVVVLDGGLATELERRGARLDDALWSAGVLLDRPALIAEVHADYVRAGADVLTTASYQASVEGFATRGLDREAALAAMRSSVRLARSAGDRTGGPVPLVAGSLGPRGAALADGSEYRGGYDISPARLTEFHRPRIEALSEAGVDLFALETMPVLGEVDLVLDLLARAGTVPAWVSFSCRDARTLAGGESLREAVRVVARHPLVLAVGINCVPPDLVADALRACREATDLPLVCYPNSGERWHPGRRAWVGDPQDRLDPATWYDLGARLIGGCCRTTPATIAALRRALAAPARRS